MGDVMEWVVRVEGVGEIGAVTADYWEDARHAAYAKYATRGVRTLGDLTEQIYENDEVHVTEA